MKKLLSLFLACILVMGEALRVKARLNFKEAKTAT